MNLTRRSFLRWASLSTVGAVACGVFADREFDLQSPASLPEDLVSGEDNWYATLCSVCPEQEGVLVRVFQGRAKKVQGNPLYPTNQGKQSVRCDGGLQDLYHPDRIAGPLVRTGPRGSGQYAAITWDDALNRLGAELRGRQAPNNLLTLTQPLRGHLGNLALRFTEAYGGRHLAFESMESTVQRRAIKEVFGQDRLPHFDIENSRFLLSFGADFLSTWTSPTQYSVGYGHFRDSHDRNGASKNRGYMVHADPRFSATAASADEWLPVRPGTEGILALSMAYVIMKNADLYGIAPSVVNVLTGGAGPDALAAFDPDVVADGIIGGPNGPVNLHGQSPSQVVQRIAEQFARQRPSLAIGGGEAAAHTNGLFNLRAIYALNFLVGNINQPGGVVFNPPPPVDGTLTASSPASLEDWEDAIARLNNGQTRVMMVHGANPVHGLPADLGFWNAINRSESDLYLVSFATIMDETTEMADLVLPVRAPMEDWGDDVPDPAPGHQVLGMRQPVVNPLPGLDPRGFGDLLLTLAQELGLDARESALRFNTFQDVLRQQAQALYDLDRGSIRRADAANDPDRFWRLLLQRGGWWDQSRRSSDPAPAPPDLAALAGLPQADRSPQYTGAAGQYHLVPFASNSLLEGQGAHMPWLQAAPDPVTTVVWQTWLEINPGDARREGLEMGDLVRVRPASEDGREVIAVVYPHPAMPPGLVSMPVGQGHTGSGRYARGKGANVISFLDPLRERETGALAWASNRIRLEREGTSVRITKFENRDASFQGPPHRIAQVTRG